MVLGMEPTVSCLLGKPLSTGTHPYKQAGTHVSPFVCGLFCLFVCLGFLLHENLLFSLSY